MIIQFNRHFIKSTLIFILSHSLGLAAQAQTSNTVLTQLGCSGQISDMNCYKDIIRREAHRQNVMDGHVPATEEDYRNGTFQKAVFEGRKILVDIQDQQSCLQVAESLQQSASLQAKGNSLNLNQLCEIDPQSPDERFRSVTLMWETSEEYLTPLNLKFLTNDESNIVNSTRNLSYLMLATMGILWVLPESISKWNKEEIRNEGFSGKWKKNVTSRPVIDKDDFVINYVGHPVSGAIYYNVARSQGFSRMKSFGYSVIMSTFFWEYGFEAVAERPSIQDLISTPVLGSLLGELFFQWGERIKTNNGKVLGSRTIGNVVMYVLNPAERLSNSINKFLGKKFIQSATSNLVLGRRRSIANPGISSNYFGVELKFEF